MLFCFVLGHIKHISLRSHITLKINLMSYCLSYCLSFMDSVIYHDFRDSIVFHPLFGLKSQIKASSQKLWKSDYLSHCWKLPCTEIGIAQPPKQVHRSSRSHMKDKRHIYIFFFYKKGKFYLLSGLSTEKIWSWV